jgi:hypothetical protein
MDEIISIIPSPIPFKLDEKIFHYTDDKGNQIGEPYSYNDWIKQIEAISGVNEELLGRDDG